jgi:hypothetical protein
MVPMVLLEDIDMIHHIKLFITVLAINILISVICFSGGYNLGYENGLKEGQVDALMSSAGKCFKHIERKIQDK